MNNNGKILYWFKNGFCIDAANENDAYVKAKEIGLPIEDIIISEKKWIVTNESVCICQWKSAKLWTKQ